MNEQNQLMRNMSIDTYTLNISKFCFDVRQTVIALFTIILATVTQTALAQEHSGTTTDGLTWELTEDANGNYTVLTIGGTGAMQNYGYTTVNSLWRTNAPWGYDITSVTIGDGVTSIGDFAFIGSENLASVTIGSSVESIGIGAINHCDQMTSITLPASVTTIGYAAFENCQKLTHVYINHDGEVSLTGNRDNHFNAPNLQYIAFSSPAAVFANTKTEGNWARYSDNLRAKLGNYLFLATNEGGTPAYAITNEEDLSHLASAVNSGNSASGKTFRQTENITVSNNFSGIGSFDGYSNFFSGTYDGGGHTISKINFSRHATEVNLGFFNKVQGATIRNVIIVRPILKSQSSRCNIGGLIGNCGTNNPNIIENCHVINPSLTTTNTGSNTHIGAIVGLLMGNTSITNCYYYSSNKSYDLVGVNDGNLTNVSRARIVTLGDNKVSVSPSATDAANGFVYNDESYYREGLTLTFDHADRTGYDFSGYSVGGSVIEGNTFNVPTKNVKVIATWTLELSDAADNTTAIADAASSGETIAVGLHGRTLYKDGAWNTLCLPFGISDFSGTPLEGATVKTLTGASFNSNDGTLTLNFTEDAKNLTKIEAGKPYIVKWASGDDIENPMFSGVTISATTPTDIKPIGEGSDGSVTFKGVFNPVTIGEGGDDTKLYLGAGNKLYWPSSARSINAFRAYFELNIPNQARAFVLNFDGEESPTGIVSTTNYTNFTNSAGAGWYTIGGRKLSGKPTTKGIYINNGKKVVIK